jgi:hypothetical protein
LRRNREFRESRHGSGSLLAVAGLVRAWRDREGNREFEPSLALPGVVDREFGKARDRE